MNPMQSVEPPAIPEPIPVTVADSTLAAVPKDNPATTAPSAAPKNVPKSLATEMSPPQSEPSEPPVQPRSGYKRANSVSFDDRDKIRSRLNTFGGFGAALAAVGAENDTYKGWTSTSSRPSGNSSPFDSHSSYFSHHQRVCGAPECRLVSCEELCEFLLHHYTSALPETEKMFPWLHGVHRNNVAQIRFLSSLSFGLTPAPMETLQGGSGSFQVAAPTGVRSLMVVRSSNTNGGVSSCYEDIITETTGQIKGSVAPGDVLSSAMSVRNVGAYLETALPEDILSEYALDQLVRDCLSTKLLPVFKDMDPQVGVSLRNFHIQVAKLSNISDLVVYCLNTDHSSCVEEGSTGMCKCVSLARLLRIAQVVWAREHPEIEISVNNIKSSPYNTFVLGKAQISTLEQAGLLSIRTLAPESSLKAPGDLCSEYDLRVFNNWDSNYLYREKLEISKMSSATPVTRNVWFGNTTDFECLHIQLNTGQLSTDKIEVVPSSWGLMPVPTYCNPCNTIVTLTKNDLANRAIREVDAKLITFPRAPWSFFVHCVDGASFPSVAELQSLLEASSDEQVYLEFPPSGSVGLGDLSEDDILATVNLCKLLYYRGSSEYPALLYCLDGYTETSLLGLSFLMYAENIGVDEALVKLHTVYGRPFFIFKSDYVLLQKFEPILCRFSPLSNDESTRSREPVLEDNRVLVKTALLAPQTAMRGVSVGVTNGVVFSTATGQHVVQLRGAARQTLQEEETNEDDLGEVDGPCQSVMGSLPSRILPHLYLGSLSHASSLPLLKELGINYIVSVGEKVPWVDGLESTTSRTESGCEILHVAANQRQNRSRCCVEEVMKISNINDDGIGTLTKTINDALDFIDRCHSVEGKVLVHCQVGVSRSATVCIAEVMKRLNVSLPRAYLYVRVRRLNVIIQPNLKLMYELFKWEESFVLSKQQKQKQQRKQKHKRQESVSSQTSLPLSNSSTVFSASTSSERPSFSTSVSSSVGSNFVTSSVRENSKARLSIVNFEKAIAEETDDVFVNSDSSDSEHVPAPVAVSVPELKSVSFSRSMPQMQLSESQSPGVGEDTGAVISNSPSFVREADWFILCREIYNLNRAYIKPG